VKSKRVITYGTFDVLHAGHINLLRRAKELGDELIVALSTDAFNSGKNKSALLSYENRRLVLEAIKYVDFVIPEETWEQKRQDIQRYSIDIFVIGDDWAGKFDFLSDICEVMYLPRTRNISSTQIRNDIKDH
jgi:glycerol-3-phosphate cytidylyltransferase